MKKYIIFLLSLLIIFISGCQSNKEVVDDFSTLKNHTVTDFSGREISFTETPEKIVALGNGEVDILYALGMNVIGRPNGEAIIKETESALEVGSTHSVDLERITSLSPDVVLGNEPMNVNDIETIENIGSEMILTSGNSVKEIQEQIQLFGDLLQKQTEAESLIKEINQKIEDLEKSQLQTKPRVLLIYGAPGTNMAALSSSLTGNILEMVGGENIAKDYPILDVYPQYAQLNTEKIIESNPEFILFTGHGDPEAVKDSFEKELKNAAGWKSLSAVKNNHVYILPPTLFGTNPGTKITDSLDYLHTLLHEAEQ